MTNNGVWRLELDDKFENAYFPIPGEYEDQDAAIQAAKDLVKSEQSLGELPPNHFAYLGSQRVPEHEKDCLIAVGPNGERVRLSTVPKPTPRYPDEKE